MLLWHVSTSFEFLYVIFCTFKEHHSKKCEMHLWFVLTSFEFKNVIFWTFKEHYRKHMRDNHQISANNSTPLRYSKKNLVFGYYSGTNTEPNGGLLLDSSNIRIGTLKII